VHDALSAAQTVRQVLGGEEIPLSDYGNAMTCRAWAQSALELLEVVRGHRRRRPASSR
jgi:hypothetical protein